MYVISNDLLPKLLKSSRKAFGLTQSELAQAACLSLPFVQQIESGKGNPSLQSLSLLLKALGLELQTSPRADWSVLSALGLPILSKDLPPIRPSSELLIENLRSACMELANASPHPDTARRVEALGALLLALRDGYPSWYKKHIARSELMQSFCPKSYSGRIIKLRRICLARLSEYL
jgi:transcriptional regulator with XRE-family HTH domain